MASTTSPVDVSAMSESEFLAFVTGSLEELARDLNRAAELLSDSNEELKDALGIPTKPRLALVKDSEDA